MTVNVQFFQQVGAGDGTIDPLRILSVPGRIANDLDTRVLFTARGARNPAYSEEATFQDGSVPNNGGNWNPGFRTTRAYVAPPLILATFQNQNGLRFYPSFRYGYYTFKVYSNRESDNTYTVIAELKSKQEFGTPTAGGLLRISVIGKVF